MFVTHGKGVISYKFHAKPKGVNYQTLDLLFYARAEIPFLCPRALKSHVTPYRVPFRQVSDKMAASTSVDDYMPTFYVGHHDNHRALPTTSRILRKAQDAGVSEKMI